MRSSTERARARILAVVDEAASAKADLRRLAAELFTLVAALDATPALKRLLTEPSVPVGAKQTVLHQLLDGQAGDMTIKAAEASVESRWSRVHDLPDSVEYAGVTALAAEADGAGKLADVEDELFRLTRILESQSTLRDVLIDEVTPLEARQHLLRGLLTTKANQVTIDLATQAVRGRHRSIVPTLIEFSKVVAARRDRLVATAWVAAPLSDDHRDRITRALSKQYSHEIQLNEIVDASVLGGVRVAIGDDVIDSTVETRLMLARRRLVH